LQPLNIYEAVGGEKAWRRIVEHFYDKVAQDETLRPMYPADLEESKEHLALFLMQYWGGPNTYSQGRGHPRLRMRHLPFAIGRAERDAWMRHMNAAVRAEKLPAEIEAALLQYFERTATFMMNR